MASRRFKESRFAREPAVGERYAAVMNEYIALGHAKEMTASEEVNEPIGKTWWLPHHAVINPNKPGKVRVVFDAAAKFHGVSLNEALLKEPDLLTSLVGVLIRFRQFPIAVSADIVKMFHQVRVPEEDCSALRFLWRNPGSGDKIRTYQMKVQIFGAVSSPTICAYALRQAASDSESDVPFAVTQVINNFYVDNWLTSFKTLEQAINAADIMTRVLAKAGFELAQWGSSSRQVLHGRLKGDAAIDLDLDQLPTERTLGLWWNSSTDVEPNGNTKREILKTVSSIFDPLGFLVPVTFVARQIMQQTWLQKVDWDEPISPSPLLNQWKTWVESLKNADPFSIRRCLTPKSGMWTKTQLHVFTDASEQGFGVVAYLGY